MVLLVSPFERARGADLAPRNIWIPFFSGIWAGTPEAFESLFVAALAF
tara:strand:- start:260 stop:403 length:144 start_codon:yes stop_codon:yes gene_type:complete